MSPAPSLSAALWIVDAVGPEKAAARIEGVGADPCDAEGVPVAADLADDRGAVVGVRARGADDDAALPDGEVLVVEPPAPLAVDDAHPGTAATRPGPGVPRVDAAWCRLEVELLADEVRRGGRRVLAGRCHVVEDRRFARRLHVCGLHALAARELLREVREIADRRVHVVVDRQVGDRADRRGGEVAGLEPNAFLGTEQRAQRHGGAGGHAVEGPGVGAPSRLDAARADTQRRGGIGDHDELWRAVGRRRHGGRASTGRRGLGGGLRTGGRALPGWHPILRDVLGVSVDRGPREVSERSGELRGVSPRGPREVSERSGELRGVTYGGPWSGVTYAAVTPGIRSS